MQVFIICRRCPNHTTLSAVFTLLKLRLILAFFVNKIYNISRIESGQSYDNPKRTICINVIDFNITHKQDYHTEVVAKDNDTNEQFTDLMSIQQRNSACGNQL
ncbi:MAG: hypothetical protein E7505_01575 [Ruminococcus sp.]|nr:hypothetical protein [Ruminococcus sp.]